MRLLRTDTLTLVEVTGTIPPYVILSHTWGKNEVSFEDLNCRGSKAELAAKLATCKPDGYKKLEGCAKRAAQDGYEYIWVDTCWQVSPVIDKFFLLSPDARSIDKSSSAELSEAINSMYSWYQEASICYAYMSDVILPSDADSSKVPLTRPVFHSIKSILCDYENLPRTFENSRWFTRGYTARVNRAPNCRVL
jgi:Heterokaryon incompatibility protein (HET).